MRIDFFYNFIKKPQKSNFPRHFSKRFFVFVLIRRETDYVSVVLDRLAFVNTNKIGVFIEVGEKHFRPADRVHFRYERLVAIGQKRGLDRTAAHDINFFIFAFFQFRFQLVKRTYHNTFVAYMVA